MVLVNDGPFQRDRGRSAVIAGDGREDGPGEYLGLDRIGVEVGQQLCPNFSTAT